jgi:serine protease Do
MAHTFEPVIFKVNTAEGSGTSFYLKDKDIFVTNYHVVGQFKQIALEDHDGNRFLGNVIMVNPDDDIAFVRAETAFELPHLPLHPHESVNRGDKVYVAGFPFGMPFTVTEGVVSAPSQPMSGKNYIQTDAAVNPGNSGGPVLNANGEVIGITTSKFSDADNMGFAVPISVLKDEFDKLSSITSNSFNLVCESCKALVPEGNEYCDSCGAEINMSYFEEPLLTDFSRFCEDAIASLGISPVLARKGYEFWEFYVDSALVRLFIYNSSYLYATSPINALPAQNILPLLEELVTKDLSPFKLGIYNKEVFVSYRTYVSDIFSSRSHEIQKNITALFHKANELDDYFVEKFGCDYSNYSKKKKKA